VAESGTPTHQDAEQRMRELIQGAGLPDPDEVRYEFDPNEVVLTWHDPKLAVVIDLEDDGPQPTLASESAAVNRLPVAGQGPADGR
jgi:hypothetical protein